MSEYEINKAKSETLQSNAKLEQALDHFKDAVDTKAESVEQKRQAAKDFIENTFEGAESFLDRQTDMLHRTLSNTRSETENFLKDVQKSVDAFTLDLQNSVSRMLGRMDDRRLTTFTSLFLAGCLVGSYLGRRYLSRRESDQTSDLNPATAIEMKKIA